MTKTKKDDGGPAFPVVFRHQDASGVVRSQEWPGLSLRDYFAGQIAGHIMSVLLRASGEAGEAVPEAVVPGTAWRAYQLADELIAAKDCPRTTEHTAWVEQRLAARAAQDRDGVAGEVVP